MNEKHIPEYDRLLLQEKDFPEDSDKNLPQIEDFIFVSLFFFFNFLIVLYIFLFYFNFYCFNIFNKCIIITNFFKLFENN